MKTKKWEELKKKAFDEMNKSIPMAAIYNAMDWLEFYDEKMRKEGSLNDRNNRPELDITLLIDDINNNDEITEDLLSLLIGQSKIDDWDYEATTPFKEDMIDIAEKYLERMTEEQQKGYNEFVKKYNAIDYTFHPVADEQQDGDLLDVTFENPNEIVRFIWIEKDKVWSTYEVLTD